MYSVNLFRIGSLTEKVRPEKANTTLAQQRLEVRSEKANMALVKQSKGLFNVKNVQNQIINWQNKTTIEGYKE